MRALPVRSRRLAAAALCLLAAALPGAAARAQGASFVAGLDRDAAAPDEPFTYEVTLTVANENVEDYKAPDFRGLRVLSAPQFPSRSTQMQIGGGQTVIQNGYSWRYELAVPAGSKGPFVIGPARARVGGREVRSNSITVRVGSSSAGGGAPAGRPQRGGGSFFDPFAGLGTPSGPPPASSGADAAGSGGFVRATPDKTRVFVGEQVTVAWSLYVSQSGRPEITTEPRTDGFWTEEIPSTTPKGQLNFAPEVVGGRTYQAALLYKKGLFPLRAGKLTITPLEAAITQVDFFGAAVRRMRLKAEPLTIEVLPLPTEGQPADFDPANVGKLMLATRADRTKIAVGEAVTLTIEVRGAGNIRNVRLPTLPALAGWKSYEPKVNVSLDAGESISGAKTAEILILPERAGVTEIPALAIDTFNPETKKYERVQSEPLRLEVTGEAAPAARGAGAVPAPAGVDNVIAPEIRPVRARAGLSRNVGATFVHSGAFTGILVLPPAALGLTLLFERLRDRFADAGRRARRRVRSMVRKRLAAAEAHRDAGRTSAFYIEIDRVLRETLAARLGSPVSGLRLDELADVLRARGLPADDVTRIVSELEACDRARFAPGGDPAGGAAMAAALDRAGDLILTIQKGPLREEARA